MSEIDGRDIVIALRGGAPDTCDYCGAVVGSQHIFPDEGGTWSCGPCVNAAIDEAKKWREQQRDFTPGEREGYKRFLDDFFGA